jgi:hypothetical protein
MALKTNLPVSAGINTPKGTDYTEHLGTGIEKSVSVVKGKDTGPLGTSTLEFPGAFCKKATGCSVTVSGGRTLNLGNYESARIDVAITVPCDPELINAAYDWGSEWVSTKITEAVSGVK